MNSKVKSHNQIGDLFYTKNNPTGPKKLATTNEEKVYMLNDYFSSVFITETYEEVVEETIFGIPNMDKLIIDEDAIYLPYIRKAVNLML